jgi:hypothetical protein
MSASALVVQRERGIHQGPALHWVGYFSAVLEQAFLHFRRALQAAEKVDLAQPRIRARLQFCRRGPLFLSSRVGLSPRGICFSHVCRSLFRGAVKRSISTLALLLGLIAIAAAQTPTKPVPRTQTLKQYCHPEYGFCFKYPSSWLSLGPIFDGNGIVIAPPQRQDRALWDEVTVALMIPPPEGDEDPVSVDQAIDKAVLSVRATGQNFDTVERQQRIVDGNPAQVVKLHYVDQSSGREWMEELVFVEGPDSEIYSAGLKCAPESLARMEPLFSRIVDSWKLPEPEPPPSASEEAAPPGKSSQPPKDTTPKVAPKPNP